VLCSFFTLLFLNRGICFADIFKYIDEKGVPRFTNIKKDTRYKLYIKVKNEDPEVFMNKYGSLINQASRQFNLKPSLVKAVIMVESGFDPKAVSKKGAQGLMQLMPKTAVDMAIDDPHNPEENIFGGTRYLSKLMERFKNDVKLALAAYNAGPERVEKYNGVPPFPETERFIKKVMSFYKQYESKK
jgi:soluble lytic murein transglycosylase